MTLFARSMPCSRGRWFGLSTRPEPTAASTWNQAPCACARSASASSGSIAPRSVVPAVPTMAITCSPRVAASKASSDIAPVASVSTPITDSVPRPSSAALRRMLSWLASDATIRQSLGGRPARRTSVPARSRASSSPSRFEAVPPIVITPEPVSPSPCSRASQPTSASSANVAAGEASNASIDWLVTPTASSPAAAAISGAGCRCATVVGSPRRRPPRRSGSSSSSTRPIGAPSAGHGSSASAIARSSAAAIGERGPGTASARESASTVASTASRSAAWVAGSAVTNSICGPFWHPGHTCLPWVPVARDGGFTISLAVV